MLQLEDGAEDVVAKGDIQMMIPPGMGSEEAATLGVGIVTIGQSLYQSLQLPLPSAPAKEAFPVLIYAGSTATGTLAIQFAKLEVSRSRRGFRLQRRRLRSRDPQTHIQHPHVRIRLHLHKLLCPDVRRCALHIIFKRYQKIHLPPPGLQLPAKRRRNDDHDCGFRRRRRDELWGPRERDASQDVG